MLSRWAVSVIGEAQEFSLNVMIYTISRLYGVHIYTLLFTPRGIQPVLVSPHFEDVEYLYGEGAPPLKIIPISCKNRDQSWTRIQRSLLDSSTYPHTKPTLSWFIKMSNGILRTEGDKVIDNSGNSVLLRGAGLGGWMNMENFITGYPGHESQHRSAMLQVLGKEKSDFFFDKFLEYFFTEADAKFFASLGLNCIRLPFNYRHFEDDMNPRILKESGFKHLDRVIELVSISSDHSSFI